MEAAKMRVEIWRTEQANNRTIDKATQWKNVVNAKSGQLTSTQLHTLWLELLCLTNNP
jgi:hypothetical protein